MLFNGMGNTELGATTAPSTSFNVQEKCKVGFPCKLSNQSRNNFQPGRREIILGDDDVKNPLPFALATNPEQLSDDDLYEIYKNLVFFQSHEGLVIKHTNVKGRLSFSAIFLVPDFPISDEETEGFQNSGLKLFSSEGVQIKPGSSVLPEYLDFVNGAVYCHTPVPVGDKAQAMFTKALRKALVSEMIGLIGEIESKGGDTWDRFYNNFSWNIKMGVCTDFYNRTKLQEFLRFRISGDSTRWISLRNYVDEMPEHQQHIFFVTNPGLKSRGKNSCLARLSRESKQVLLMPEPIDDFLVSQMKHYDGVLLQSASTYQGTREKAAAGDKEATDKKLVDFIRKVLSDEVSGVVSVPSGTLASSPACVVARDVNKTRTGRSSAILRSQSHFREEEGQLRERQVLQFDSEHPIMRRLSKNVSSASRRPSQSKSSALSLESEAVQALFVSSALASGHVLPDYRPYQDVVVRLAERIMLR